MRARLALLVVATTTVVLLAFLLPLALSISRAQHDNALQEAEALSQSLASTVTAGSRADIETGIATVQRRGYPVAVRLSGQRLGDARPDTAQTGVPSASTVTRLGSGDILIRQPVLREADVALVSTLVPEARLRDGVLRAWLVLAGLGMLLILLSLVVADRLARAITSPITDLAHAAERLGRGDLEARVDPAGPDEVREVGRALNRLAARIEELLSREREAVADLSHRLRTPITALRLDADGLRDVEERARLAGDVDDLSRQVDALIIEARRPMREGVQARCDARAVVAERAAFWGPLAEDQQRTVRVDVPEQQVDVRASTPDLEAALDALIGNVISHTDEGVAFTICLRPLSGGGGEVVVADEGTGFPDVAAAVARGESGAGSSGLGLDIARNTAIASGGGLTVLNGVHSHRGATVTMRLGPPATA